MPNRLKLLVVEDNDAHFFLAKRALNVFEDDGIIAVIDRATTVAEATKILTTGPYLCDLDIVLLDLRLPDSDGPEGLLEIKKHCPDIPIVILSGMEDVDLSLRLIELGAEDFIPKSELSHKRLMRSLQFAFARRQNRKELESLDEKPLTPRELLAALREIRRKRSQIVGQIEQATKVRSDGENKEQ